MKKGKKRKYTRRSNLAVQAMPLMASGVPSLPEIPAALGHLDGAVDELEKLTEALGIKLQAVTRSEPTKNGSAAPVAQLYNCAAACRLGNITERIAGLNARLQYLVDANQL